MTCLRLGEVTTDNRPSGVIHSNFPAIAHTSLGHTSTVVDVGTPKGIEEGRGMFLEKAESSDEMMLERLWGDEVTQIAPEVRRIIASALRKAQERRDRYQSPVTTIQRERVGYP